MKSSITSKNVLNLLLQKHYKDLCIPECKTGSTWFSKKLFIMDLWVMSKSWSKPHTFCYEIKVNRQDFLNDDKWTEYLKYCSDFYFATPPGIIESNELPKEAGLIITSVNAKKLFIKKKAISRLDINIPESLYKYILMWRSMQKDEKEIISHKFYWKSWLDEKKIDYEFGNNVSKKIREEIDKKIKEVEKENYTLKQENENLKEIKKILLDFNFKEEQIKSSFSFYNIKNNFEYKLKEILNNENIIEKDIEKTILSLNNILNKIREIK